MDTSSVVAHRGLPVTLAPSLAGGWHLIIARWLAGTRAQGAILPGHGVVILDYSGGQI